MRTVFSPELMKKAERYGLIGIALMVLVSVGVTLLASGTSLLENISCIPWSAVLWLVIITVIQSLLRFARYEIAARALRLNVPWYRHLYYYAVGYALIPTPGKVGMAIRLWLLKHYHNLPYRRTAPLMVMDLISDAIAMFALVAICLLVLEDPRLQTLGLLAGAGLAVGLAGMLIAPRLMVKLVKFLYALTGRRKRRLFAKVLGIVRTMAQVFGQKVMLSTIALSFVAWGLSGIAVGVLVAGFGVEFGWAQGILALNLSNIGGFLSMMPAGIGGAEVSMAAIFSLFAVPFGISVLATAIIRLVVVWLSVAVGLVLLPFAVRNAPRS